MELKQSWCVRHHFHLLLGLGRHGMAWQTAHGGVQLKNFLSSMSVTDCPFHRTLPQQGPAWNRAQEKSWGRRGKSNSELVISLIQLRGRSVWHAGGNKQPVTRTDRADSLQRHLSNHAPDLVKTRQLYFNMSRSFWCWRTERGDVDVLYLSAC